MNLRPQLADPIDKTLLPEYAQKNGYFFSQKINGVRKLVIVQDGKVKVVGRDGQSASIPMENEFRYNGTWAFDGELLPDGIYHIFDMPVANDLVGISTPYRLRSATLESLRPTLESERVRVLPVARTTVEKLTLAKNVLLGRGEGVMVYDTEAGYASGRRTPAILKAKLVKTFDGIITRFGVGNRPDGSPKQNVALAAYDSDGKLREVGTCIIHAKVRKQVEIGSVVTCDYLYAQDPDNPRLVQPTNLRLREPADKAPEQCLFDQIVFTNGEIQPIE